MSYIEMRFFSTVKWYKYANLISIVLCLVLKEQKILSIILQHCWEYTFIMQLKKILVFLDIYYGTTL